MRPFRALAALAAAPALVLLVTAGPASAVLPPTGVPAATHLSNRDDSGANGNWAKDNIWRVARITSYGPAKASQCGGHNPCNGYGVTITDTGYFATIPGAYTPNQSGAYLNQKIRGQIGGSLLGSLTFGEFYSTSKPNISHVPASANGDTLSTGTWPWLFFASGTTLYQGGVAAASISEPSWSWGYTAQCVEVSGHVVTEHWTDALTNGYGDDPGDGNITGCPA